MSLQKHETGGNISGNGGMSPRSVDDDATLKISPKDKAESARIGQIELKEHLMRLLKAYIQDCKIIEINKPDPKNDRTTTRIAIFSIDPAWHGDVVASLLKSMHAVMMHSLESSEIHEHLSPEQVDAQIYRHSPEKLLEKMKDLKNPHVFFVALKFDEKKIRVVGFIDVDTEIITASGGIDDSSTLDEIRYNFSAQGVEIKSGFVDEGWQGYGIGSALFIEAVRFVYSYFFADILVKVPHSVLAEKFFEKFGLTKIGLRQDLVPDKDGRPVEHWFTLMAFFEENLKSFFRKSSTTQNASKAE